MMELHCRLMAAVQPKDMLRRQFDLTEQEATELDLFGRYLRGEIRRKPALNLCKDLGVTLTTNHEFKFSVQK